jgi:DNA-directed RNA polymerase sigma subunit (sigma70/sigma32)
MGTHRTLKKGEVRQLLERLPAMERQLLAMRFGLEDGRPRSTRECAQAFGTTLTEIRRVEQAALQAMRDMRHGEPIAVQISTPDAQWAEQRLLDDIMGVPKGNLIRS